MADQGAASSVPQERAAVNEDSGDVSEGTLTYDNVVILREPGRGISTKPTKATILVPDSDDEVSTSNECSKYLL
jgi:hypothetical protein